MTGVRRRPAAFGPALARARCALRGSGLHLGASVARWPSAAVGASDKRRSTCRRHAAFGVPGHRRTCLGRALAVVRKCPLGQLNGTGAPSPGWGAPTPDLPEWAPPATHARLAMARWTHALLGAVAVAQATAMAQDVEAEGAIAGMLARARQSIAQAANAAKQYTQVAERASELGYAARDYQNSALGASQAAQAIAVNGARFTDSALRAATIAEQLATIARNVEESTIDVQVWSSRLQQLDGAIDRLDTLDATYYPATGGYAYPPQPPLPPSHATATVSSSTHQVTSYNYQHTAYIPPPQPPSQYLPLPPQGYSTFAATSPPPLRPPQPRAPIVLEIRTDDDGDERERERREHELQRERERREREMQRERERREHELQRERERRERELQRERERARELHERLRREQDRRRGAERESRDLRREAEREGNGDLTILVRAKGNNAGRRKKPHWKSRLKQDAPKAHREIQRRIIELQNRREYAKTMLDEAMGRVVGSEEGLIATLVDFDDLLVGIEVGGGVVQAPEPEAERPILDLEEEEGRGMRDVQSGT